MIADILALDAGDRPVLVVEIKGRVLDAETAKRILDYLESEDPPIPFGMVVDIENIHLLKYDCKGPAGFACSFRTADILKTYDPEFESKRIFPQYLTTLVEAWLNDLANHWKSPDPPGADRLESIGLLSKLEGGTTRIEVGLGADAVR